MTMLTLVVSGLAGAIVGVIMMVWRLDSRVDRLEGRKP